VTFFEHPKARCTGAADGRHTRPERL